MNKKNLLWLLVPAFIAGFFSIAPKLYDIITEPKKELVYSLIYGPSIEEKNKSYKSIIILEIKNSGKIPLHSVTSNLNIEDGIIEKYNIDDQNILKPTIKITNNSLELMMDTMLENDSLKLSLLINSLKENPKLNNIVRSKEAKGLVNESIAEKPNSIRLSLIGSMLSGFSVLLMSLIILRVKYLPSFLRLFSFFKNDNLFYIVSMTGDFDLLRIIHEDSLITYLRVSDFLTSKYLNTDNDEMKIKYINAQICMLLIDRIASISRQVISKNVEIMTSTKLTKEEMNVIEKKRTDDVFKIRDEINNIFKSNYKNYLNV